MKNIYLRVDIDTHTGLKKGIPEILRIIKDYNFSATFYCVMGTDEMGQHLKRFRHKNYWKRIIRVNPLKFIKKYGARSFLYGTLLKSPSVADGNEDILRNLKDSGFDIGIHSFCHRLWADAWLELDQDFFKEDFHKAVKKYYSIFNEYPDTSAAPNWRLTESAVKIEEIYKFRYVSDIRGKTPFYPVFNNTKYHVLQIPSTLPCFHELLQLGIKKDKLVDEMFNHIRNNDFNMLTIHDWFEGLLYPEIFYEFVKKSVQKNYRIRFLRDILEHKYNSYNYCKIITRQISGGIGEIAMQGDIVL